MARHPRPTSVRSPTAPLLQYQQDPIRLTVQRLGRKWTLLLLRDLAFLKLHRFGELRRNNPGLSARVLSRRLHEMEAEGLIARRGTGGTVRYRLTRRGEDAVYILLALLRYGLRHYVGPQPLGSDRGTGGADLPEDAGFGPTSGARPLETAIDPRTPAPTSARGNRAEPRRRGRGASRVQ